MKTKQIEINRFDLGVTDEERDLSNGYFRYLENLEVGDKTRTVKQTPNTAETANDRMIVSLLEVAGTVYGLGHENSTTDDTTIYSGSFSTAFSAVTSGTVASTTFNNFLDKPLFEYYNGVIYFNAGNGYTGSYTIATNTMDATYSQAPAAAGLKGGAVWQGNIYGWWGQIVCKVNTTSAVTSQMITIPADQTIVELLPYGNYLLIVCSSIYGASKMYIWDGVTTTTFADIAEIGYGTVAGADTLDGQVHTILVFPSKRGFRIKRYNGNVFTTEYTYSSRANAVKSLNYIDTISRVKSFTSYLYFIVAGSRPYSSDTTVYEQVMFRYGRKDVTKQNSLSVYKSLELTEGTGYDDTGTRNDFVITEKYSGTVTTAYPKTQVVAVLASATSSMTEVKTVLTDNAGVYSSQAGILETGIYTGGDSSIEKKLVGVAGQFVALGTASTVSIAYKKDEEVSWTTVLTEVTSSAIAHEAVTIETAGTALPYWREIAFRASVLGGAELTGLKFKYEELNGLV